MLISKRHGLPGQAETAASEEIFPRPPELFKDTGVTDDPPGETYWRVNNGIRLTGMPTYGSTLSKGEMWQVSLLLANADKLTPLVRETLQKTLAVH